MDIEILMTGPKGSARILAAQIKNMLLEPGDRLIVKHQAHASFGGPGTRHGDRPTVVPPVAIMDVSV